MWQPTPQARDDELIVMFDPSLAFSDQIGVLTGAGYTVVHSLRSLNAHLVRVDFQSQAAQLHAASLPGVISVEPNYVVSKSNNMIPNDPHYSHQWHYDWMRLPQAWNVTTGDRSIRIAVLDTGVDPNHEDLRANLDLEYAYDFVLGSSTMYDTDGHGTHVAGTIGAVTNNALGVAGVMWDVEILPLKVLDDSGEGSNYHLAWGVLYAAGLEDDLPYNPRPVDVINMSLGGSHNDLIEAAVQRVLQAGVAIVAATGNDGLSVLYPAAYEGVIGVGAVEVGRDGNPTKASYSNYGDGIDVVAPGGSWEYAVISTVPGSEYEAWAGTSMATPHVSGLVGLMLANDIPSHEIVDTLHRTSMPLTDADFDPYYGYGLVNAYWAINGVDRMRIIVGQRVEDTVQVTLESSLHPKGGEFDMLVAPGRYQLIAWVDVNRNNRVDQGDYYSESEYYSFEPGSELEFGGVIEEIGSWEDIDSQTEKGIGKQVRQ
jgi:subtilisin family serine protease